MEYQILFGCTQCVELRFVMTVNNIIVVILMKIYMYISDVYQYYFSHNNMLII
jgi:hypothetical protein